MLRLFSAISILLIVSPLVGAQPVAVVPQPTAATYKAQAYKAQAMALLKRFSHEPSVLRVQRAAARYARVNGKAYKSWMKASNWAHLLPERLKGQVLKLNRDERDVRTTTSTDSLSELLTLDDHLRLEVEVQWDLSKLIFNPDKLKVSKEISNLVELREEVLTTVNKLYFARRRLQVEVLINPPRTLRQAVHSSLRVDSLTADLDALTGGWFSRQLKAAKLRSSKKATRPLSRVRR
jgi:hypothetical protein